MEKDCLQIPHYQPNHISGQSSDSDGIDRAPSPLSAESIFEVGIEKALKASIATAIQKEHNAINEGKITVAIDYIENLAHQCRKDLNKLIALHSFMNNLEFAKETLLAMDAVSETEKSKFLQAMGKHNPCLLPFAKIIYQAMERLYDDTDTMDPIANVDSAISCVMSIPSNATTFDSNNSSGSCSYSTTPSSASCSPSPTKGSRTPSPRTSISGRLTSKNGAVLPTIPVFLQPPIQCFAGDNTYPPRRRSSIQLERSQAHKKKMIRAESDTAIKKRVCQQNHTPDDSPRVSPRNRLYHDNFNALQQSTNCKPPLRKAHSSRLVTKVSTTPKRTISLNSYPGIRANK